MATRSKLINMYSNQGGKSIELFTAQGRDPLAKIQMTGGRTVRKEFDDIIKGYVLSLNGSPATSRVHLPKSDKKGLGLIHSYLLIQFFLPQDSRTIIELTTLDATNCKRKLQLLSWQQEVSVSPLSVKTPLPLPPNTWQWLLIDMTDLMSNLLSQSYQSLESLSVCGSCRIRSIATLRDIVASPADLPSSWQPPPSAPSLDINIINYYSISKVSLSLNSHSSKGGGASKHVAFGEKIVIPTHIARTQQKKTERELPETGSKTKLHPLPLKSDNNIHDSLPKSQELAPQTDHFNYVSPPHSVGGSKKSHSHSKETHSRPRETHTHSRETRSQETHTHSQETHTRSRSLATGSSPSERRSENLDEDFLTLSTVNESRTKRNDDEDKSYDWQKYHSDTSSEGEEEQILEELDNSTNNESRPEQASLHETIDDTEMGGPSTPPRQSLTDDIIPPEEEDTNSNNEENNLELLYDPDLNYFYDPKTGKCYELAH